MDEAQGNLVPRDAQSVETLAQVEALCVRGRDALVEASSIAEGRHVLAFASTLEHATRVRDMNADAVIAASRLRVEAERRIGELIRDEREAGRLASNGQRGPALVPEKALVDNEGFSQSTLADHGITYDEASKYGKLAAVPEAEFETVLAGVADEAKAKGVGVTRSAVLRAVDPEAEKTPDGRWVDADRFVDACKKASKLGEVALPTIRFGQYPSGDDPDLIRSGVVRIFTTLRDQINECLRALEG